MYLLSITSMDMAHIDEICEDLKQQQEQGVTTHAMLMMYFAPEGTPAINKAEYYCNQYDKFKEKLDAAGVKHGVLVQSTLGHGRRPNVEHSFQKVESLTENATREICCPLDKNYREYIKEQMSILAKRRPEIIMIDDDVGLLYRGSKGCTCPLHMAEFNRRAGTDMTREQLWKHVQGNSDEDKRYTDIYIRLQGDALLEAVKAMREGIDSVDPSIQGAISTAANYCEFTDELAAAFAGKGNPTMARFNNGMYTSVGARFFSKNMLRAATQREILEGKIDYFLAETDTCPHNRYSTSAATLHAHMTGTILEGAKGAKHWITRSAFEPNSGKAFRKILGKNRGFYEKLSELTEELRPVGCKIPLSKVKDYCLTTPNIFAVLLSPWTSNVLERYGFPLYFSAKEGGAVFIDDDAPEKFTDEEIKKMLSGTVVLSAIAAKKLEDRGFSQYTGVKIKEFGSTPRSGEVLKINSNRIASPHIVYEIVPVNDDVVEDSHIVHIPDLETVNKLSPGTTIFKNELGGTVFTYAGTPDVRFDYTEAFSLLCESRKLQFAKFLKETGNLPVYYPGDMDVYMRAGYLADNTLMVALFNLCLDPMEEIELVCENKVNKIEKIMPDGTLKSCEFIEKDGVITVKESSNVLDPIVLLIS